MNTKTWLDEFFTSYYRHRPVNATFIGVHEQDHRLPDYSDHGAADAMTEMGSLLGSLRALPSETLTESEALDRKLAEGFLEIQLWEYDSSHFHRGNPCVYTGEAVFGVISLLLRPFAPLRQRVEAAIARMAAVPDLLRQGRANLRQAPLAWTQRAIQECAGALAFFGQGVDRLIQDQRINDRRFRDAADKARVAFADFQSHLGSELHKCPTQEVACGEEAFDRLLRRGHFLDWDAKKVASLAEGWLVACEIELEAHAAEFGASDWRGVLKRLADHHPPVDQYYARYRNLWESCRSAVESNQLLTWPDYPIQYVAQPRWLRRAAPHLYFLSYRSPAPYDEISLVDYLVTPIEPEMAPEEQKRLLQATNDSVIKLNHVVHHGGPGHHVQNWYAFRARSRIGQVAAVDCASRIALFCGGSMAEGWACYVTDLMGEVGFLTPLEQYAEHHNWLRMAARALVDVRLHSGAFTLDQAAQFYQDRIGMPPEAARNEAVKNSMFPATALIYLVGSKRIHELRREMEVRQGAGFDLRRFHDRFLSYGSIPVTLIADAMRTTTAQHGGSDETK